MNENRLTYLVSILSSSPKSSLNRRIYIIILGCYRITPHHKSPNCSLARSYARGSTVQREVRPKRVRLYPPNHPFIIHSIILSTASQRPHANQACLPPSIFSPTIIILHNYILSNPSNTRTSSRLTGKVIGSSLKIIIILLQRSQSFLPSITHPR